MVWARYVSSWNASAFGSGNDFVGLASACFTHAACTCASESPRGARSRSRTRSKFAAEGESHVFASCPPAAPFTIISVERFTARSASACPANDHGSHGDGLFAVQNSCVVFDMPREMKTILPLGDGLPLR